MNGKGQDIPSSVRGSRIINTQTTYSSSEALAYFVLESGSIISSILDQDDNEVANIYIADTGSMLSAGTLITADGDSYFKQVSVTGSIAVIKK